MQGPPTSFWGKLERDSEGRVESWHPLEDHCADVAACAHALLESTLIRPRLARLGGTGDLTGVQVARLAALAALHDIGKFNTGFQNKAFGGSGPGHVRVVLDLCASGYAEEDKLATALDIESLASWGAEPDTCLRLLIASICHHGRPYPVGVNPQGHWWRPGRGLDPFSGIHDLVQSVRRWFPEAFDVDGDPLPSEPQLQHAFSGLVMLADWLGSNTEFFPFGEAGTGDRFLASRERADEVLRRVGLDAGPARSSLGTTPPGFDRVSPHHPRAAQRAVLELPLEEHGSLTVLEAETGSGKTEAALARFARMFHAGLVDGLYFALPTRTAATQIHGRIVKAVTLCFPDADARPPVTLAVPGYLKVDDLTGERQSTFDVVWNDDDPKRARLRGWASEHRKRYLAGAIVVGTIDQALLSGLMVGHAHMRATALGRHFLIVDEVHASDAYMNRILEHVLARHLQSGGHALLMSATLGARARERFLGVAGGGADRASLAEARAFDYPSLVQQARRGLERVGIAPIESSKRVAVEIVADAGAPERIAACALDAATAGAKVLVIRNTVGDCLATQRALEIAAGVRQDLLFACHGIVAPHHSRFAREDREALDRALEEYFGKGARTGGCVAVATQTVQQSLDLDADFMLTDLCPMDVLLQRIGRLHRHDDRQRPCDFENAHIVVVVPEARDLGRLIRGDGAAGGLHGFGTVYGDLRILEATWRLLSDRVELEIPRQNRDLVEEATHPEALSKLVADLGVPWGAHANRVEGVTCAEGRLADLNLLDWTIAFGDTECQFPSGELSRPIRTRLGEGDRVADFEPAPRGPFGVDVRRLTIPAWLARDVDQDAVPEAVCQKDDVLTFRFGGTAFVYDRLGLRQLEPHDDEEEEEDFADA